jgi:uncharacterized membrane protein
VGCRIVPQGFVLEHCLGQDALCKKQTNKQTGRAQIRQEVATRLHFGLEVLLALDGHGQADTDC